MIRKETWLGLMVLGVGLLIMAVAGLWLYMSATASPLHPTLADVRSVPGAALPRWVDPIDQGRQMVRAHLVQRNLPGLSVAVGVGGDLVWAEGFGWSDLENRLPVSPNHRFRIGTASVALTSAAVGLLVDEGRLHVDEEIQTAVPEFPKKQQPVTLRQLMAHVSGVRNDGGDEGPLFGQRCERPVEAFRFFAERPLLFEPGMRYHYSSYGWIVVSAAIEAAADERFLTFMQQRVFDPLGMRDTGPDAAKNAFFDQAAMYFPRFAADPRYGPDPMREIDLSCYAGASVFLSTPSDLVRFGMAMGDGTLVQPATVRLLQTPQRLASGAETGYGLGWDDETIALAGEQARMAGHDGDLLGGNVASLMTFPERGIVVAVTSNISYADTPSLAMKIVQAFAAAAARSAPM